MLPQRTMTTPDEAVLAYIRCPDIAPDTAQCVNAAGATSDRAPGAKPSSAGLFAMNDARVREVRSKARVRDIRACVGRLGTGRLAAARSVTRVPRSGHGSDLESHHGAVKPTVSCSKTKCGYVINSRLLDSETRPDVASRTHMLEGRRTRGTHAHMTILNDTDA